MNTNQIVDPRPPGLNTDVFTSQYPGFLYYKSIANDSISTNFQPFVIDDLANECVPDWDLTWTAVRDEDSKTWSDKYPVISFDRETKTFEIDFKDESETYIGVLKVTLTGTLVTGDS